MTDVTNAILDYFEKINAIPRCSRNEAGLCRWLQQWAAERGFASEVDGAGNLLVRVSASKGFENAPIIVIQAHMDMVCEKTPTATHNFDEDPIISHREGDWLTATDTTLGADNGIAIAYMLTLVEDESIHHPSLELLFTVDEETGLNGAKELAPGLIKGRQLINLDSEDEGVFTIGCAGGVDTKFSLAVNRQSLPSPGNIHRLIVGGLIGGHSGIDIHKHRGNANQILARAISYIQTITPVQLISIDGGTRKNAIPRDAEAVIWFDQDKLAEVKQAVFQISQTIQDEFSAVEKAMFIDLKSVSADDASEKVLSQEATEHTIQLLLALPNGVSHMSPELGGAVDTSCNLATIDLTDNQLTILSSQRSASASRLSEITASVHAVAKLAGAQIEDHDAYPPWQPRVDSELLRRSQKAYRTLYNQEPVIQVIHAGLECAVIGNIFQGMDMISFGPTIRNPHSPDERIMISSIGKVWDFLVALLSASK